MKLCPAVRSLTVACATIVTLLPLPALSQAAEVVRLGQARNVVVRDVALQPNGTLRGQVLSSHGVARANSMVAVARDGNSVARVRTDEQGRFAFSGLNAGVYLVTTNESGGIVRAWQPGTAPPASAHGLLIVPTEPQARGNHHHDHDLLGGLLDGHSFGNFGIGGLIVLGAAGGIIAVAIDRGDAS